MKGNKCTEYHPKWSWTHGDLEQWKDYFTLSFSELFSPLPPFDSTWMDGFIPLFITIIFFSILNLRQLVRPCRIYGKIQTTVQIQYKGNYFPNSCIQCNLPVTLLLQLEFIWGSGSGFKSEGLRIWHGQDLCKELAVSFASCEKSDSEEAYNFCMILRLRSLLWYSACWIYYFLLIKQCFCKYEIGYVIKW